MNELKSLAITMQRLQKYQARKGPPRPGLVPQSGDPQHPVRWVLPASGKPAEKPKGGSGLGTDARSKLVRVEGDIRSTREWMKKWEKQAKDNGDKEAGKHAADAYEKLKELRAVAMKLEVQIQGEDDSDRTSPEAILAASGYAEDDVAEFFYEGWSPEEAADRLGLDYTSIDPEEDEDPRDELLARIMGNPESLKGILEDMAAITD